MRTVIVALVATACLGAAACGSTAPVTSAGDTGGSITLSTAKGDVTLPKAATRVVALEWTYAEDLMAIGVPPVGVADVKGYTQWLTAAGPLPKGTADVGTRQEPNLEAIAALKPDLIVTDTIRVTSNLEGLKSIAPVAVFNPYDTSSTQLDSMKNAFQQLAKGVAKEAEAKAEIAAMEQKAKDVAAQLKSDGKEGVSTAVAQVGSTPGAAPAVRMYTDKSLVMQVLALAGVKTGWPGAPDDYGITTVGAEALQAIPADTYFLYLQQPTDTLFTADLPKSPVWKNLSFVRDNKIKAIDPGTWFFGGPKSAQQILTETQKALGS